MNTEMLVVVSVMILGFTIIALFWKRCNKVYLYRKEIIDRIYTCSDRDIEMNRNWEWRYDVYHEVSLDNMIFRFWKRLDSFYPDKSFLEMNATKPEHPDA